MTVKSSSSRAFTTLFSARREIVRLSRSVFSPGSTRTRAAAPPSSPPSVALASRIFSPSAWALVVWKAWAMSLVTWSPPTPITSVAAM